MMQWITTFIDSMGYWGILLLMFLENVLPPIPSELIMPLGGYLCGQGRMNLPIVILAGTAGSVLGALPLYGLGRWIGQQRLCRWTERHGHWLAVSPDDVLRARQWFDRHGSKAVFLCRLVPGIRSLISIPAGAGEMPMARFLIYTIVGSAIWTAVLAWLGKLLGQNYAQVEKYVGPITYVVLGIIVVAFVVRAVRLKRARRDGSAAPSPCAALDEDEAAASPAD